MPSINILGEYDQLITFNITCCFGKSRGIKRDFETPLNIPVFSFN